MKPIFWVGLAIMILGVASFLVPIPRSEREGIRAGGVSIGIETHHQEMLSPVISTALILAGAALMIAQRMKG